MSLCYVCRDEQVPADAELDGRPVHSWHLSEFVRTTAPHTKIKEEKMAARVEIDVEQLKALHAQGMSDVAIAEKFGCSGVTVGMLRRKLGLAPVGRGGHPVYKTAAERRVENRLAKADPHMTQIAPVGEAAPLPAPEPGRVKVRFIEFEVAGDAITLQESLRQLGSAFGKGA